MSLFQPREARPKDVVSEIPIVVTAEGSYHQLAKFFERVRGASAAWVNVSGFKMTGQTKAKNSMKADLTLATYMYRSSPATPPARTGAQTTPPPKPAAALPTAEGNRS